MSSSFAQRVAIITGASSGIGLAVAKHLAREGATVILTGRNRERGERAIADIGAKQSFFWAADLNDGGAIEQLLQRTIERHGRIDVLVQCAGLTGPFAALGEYPLAAWEELLAVNLTAPFRLMRAVFPAMTAQRRGAIVNVASIAGLAGAANRAAYIASKHGLVGLTRAAALEGAPVGVRVNAVCPGGTDTPMMRAWLKDDPAAIAARGAATPMGRLATPDEVGAMIVWLCSDAASYVNGAIIPVDGGSMAMVPSRPPPRPT
ncbi:MAG: SDR family oxidoreductase [Alphaproteobacteria bacterium]|nr:SDR family oxidoreductase [Alphaproteobacteria bacterium]